MSEALYRKYRPQVFGDVVGQDHIERTIRNAIEQDKVSHAYLFCGPRGTGKTTTARLLAKALLCEKAPTSEPDGVCEDCRMIAAGDHPDVYELDAASRTGVDNVREEIIGRVQFAPTRGAKKVYIIDEVHMLSTAAFNALLKTLEEPPSHVVFILCTTDPQKVPETIHSRCQRFDFRRISAEEMVTRLGAVCVAEGVEFEGDALDLIAHRAEGGMRNALTALEQAIAYGSGRVTLDVVESLVGSLDASDLAEIVRAIGRRDVAACFTWVANYVETGADLAQFARDLAEHVRTMYVLSLAGPDAPAEVSDAERREIADELPLFGPDRLARMLGVLGDAIAELKTTTNARLTFEIALTRMVRPESDLTLAALSERIETLEARISSMLQNGSDLGSGALGARARIEDRNAGRANAGQSVAASSEILGAAISPAPQRAGSPVDAASLSAPSACSSNEVGARIDRPLPAHVDAADLDAAATAATALEADAGGGAPSASASRLSERAVAEFLNPAALQRDWQAVVAAVKREKSAYAVLLLNTRAIFDAATRRVAIEFPAESAFAFKAVQKPEVNDAVAQAFCQVMGEQVAFSFVKAQQGGAPVATTIASGGFEGSGRSFAARPDSAREEPSASSQSAAAAASPTDAAGLAAQDSQSGRESAPAFSTADAPAPASFCAEAGASVASAPARLAPEPAPDSYDEVPVDLYEGFACDSSEPASAEESPDVSHRGADAPHWASTASATASDQPAPAAPGEESPASANAPMTKENLEQMLLATFGERVRVEEV